MGGERVGQGVQESQGPFAQSDLAQSFQHYLFIIYDRHVSSVQTCTFSVWIFFCGRVKWQLTGLGITDEQRYSRDLRDKLTNGLKSLKLRYSADIGEKTFSSRNFLNNMKTSKRNTLFPNLNAAFRIFSTNECTTLLLGVGKSRECCTCHNRLSNVEMLTVETKLSKL